MARFNSQTFSLRTSDAFGLTEAQRTAVELFVDISITFESTWIYRNFKFPRYKNFYGYCQVMSGAFVVESIPLEFINQELYHKLNFEQQAFQNLTCILKDISGRVATPATPAITTVLIRDHISGFRFRLLPGIQANIAVKWEELQPACGDDVIAPDERQGQPPNPTNDDPSPNDVPDGQRDIPGDRSPNDGDSPFPGQDPPPSPGGGIGGEWVIFSVYYDAQCQQQLSRRGTGITDPSAKPTATTVATGLAPICNREDRRLVINGQPTDSSGGAFTVVSIEFRPS